MSSISKIANIRTAPEVSMGNIKLRQAFPTSITGQIGPFILLHHFNENIEPGDDRFYVAPHPHRGFSPVTFIYDGAVEHNDSLGNQEVIHANEVQWISAGRGLIHSEKIDREFANKGGKYQGIQLWINTPAKNKMDPPYYLPVRSHQITMINKPGMEFRLISGTYKGQKGPVRSEYLTAMVNLSKGFKGHFEFIEKNHSAIYILEGKIRLNETELVESNQLVELVSANHSLYTECLVDAKLLLISGEAINEPMVTHGPFVMNHQTEILQAMKDYQDGKMGFLYG